MSTRAARDTQSRIAIVGGGPSGLVAAIALARHGIATTVLERDIHPDAAPRFNPDRSYTIDISGHGLNALRHIDACASFDDHLIPFEGIRTPAGTTLPWDLPGWTGSRGDILRALMAVATERHRDRIEFRFESRVERVDVHEGEVAFVRPGGNLATERFGLVVGADGAGSIVRTALQDQVPGFQVETRTYPNWCTMLALDRVGDRLHPHYLHGLAVRPFCAAGAIKGDPGGEPYRWFCAIGTRAEQRFAGPDEVREYFRARVPILLELTSDARIEEFARRPCYLIGRTAACSSLHGGKAVLLGDAAGAFPPIGQGVNAAMESSVALATSLAQTGSAPADLIEGARRYDARWKPEVDAVAWMAVRSLFENRLHMLRSSITSKLGISIFEQAKSADIPYSAVRRRAQRLWPLWV